MLKLKDLIAEAEMNHYSMDLDKAFNVFNASYIKSTGKSWEKDKFIERARGWTFFGDENGYVAVRPQNSGMVKLVGVAGSLKSIYKGVQELKVKYNSVPVWGMVSKEIAAQVGKLGFKSLKLKNDLSSKIFLKLIKTVIPANVFGGAEIKGINPDGTLAFEYKDVGEASKILIGNDKYFDELKNKILSHEKIPSFMKDRLTKLFNEPNAISEERRNPDINLKDPFNKRLRDLSREDDIFISFTDIEKAGIFPRSKFDTPLGIYCYPLKLAAKQYRTGHGQIGFPFAGDRPNAMALRKKPNIKELVISQYTKQDGENDIQTLIDTYKDKDIGDKLYNILRTAKDTTRFKDRAIGVFWNFCRILSDELASQYGKNPSYIWNKLLRVDLGYDLVIDDAGWGVIHSNEPLQAFFTSAKGFTVIDTLKNPEASGIRRSSINYREIIKSSKSLRAFLKRRDLTAMDMERIFDLVPDQKNLVKMILDALGGDLSTNAIEGIIKNLNGSLGDIINLIGKHNTEKLSDEDLLKIYQDSVDTKRLELLRFFGTKISNHLTPVSIKSLLTSWRLENKNVDDVIKIILSSKDNSSLEETTDLISVIASVATDSIAISNLLFSKVEPTGPAVFAYIKSSKDKAKMIKHLNAIDTIKNSIGFLDTLLFNAQEIPEILEILGNEIILKIKPNTITRMINFSPDEDKPKIVDIVLSIIPPEKIEPELTFSLLYGTEDLYSIANKIPKEAISKIYPDRIGELLSRHGPIKCLDILGTDIISNINNYSMRKVVRKLTEDSIPLISFLRRIGYEIVKNYPADIIKVLTATSSSYESDDGEGVAKFIIEAKNDALTSEEIYTILFYTAASKKLVDYIGKDGFKKLNMSQISQLVSKEWNDAFWATVIIDSYERTITPEIIGRLIGYCVNITGIIKGLEKYFSPSELRTMLNSYGQHVTRHISDEPPSTSVPSPVAIQESLNYIKYCKEFMM